MLTTATTRKQVTAYSILRQLNTSMRRVTRLTGLKRLWPLTRSIISSWYTVESRWTFGRALSWRLDLPRPCAWQITMSALVRRTVSQSAVSSSLFNTTSSWRDHSDHLACSGESSERPPLMSSKLSPCLSSMIKYRKLIIPFLDLQLLAFRAKSNSEMYPSHTIRNCPLRSRQMLFRRCRSQLSPEHLLVSWVRQVRERARLRDWFIDFMTSQKDKSSSMASTSLKWDYMSWGTWLVLCLRTVSFSMTPFSTILHMAVSMIHKSEKLLMTQRRLASYLNILYLLPSRARSISWYWNWS